MIWTIVQTSWRRLRNNRSELILTFVVPIVFFSIFAVIFGSRDTAASTPKIRIAISTVSNVTSVKPEVTQMIDRISQDLRKQSAMRLTQETDSNGALLPLARQQVEELVRRGMISAGIVFETNAAGDRLSRVDILTDSYDQVASQVVSSLVQRSVFSSMPTGLPPSSLPLASSPLASSPPSGTPPSGTPLNANANANANDPRLTRMTPPVTGAIQTSPQVMRADLQHSTLQEMYAVSSAPFMTATAPTTVATLDVPPPNATGPSNAALKAAVPSIETIDVLGGRKANPTIAMYAAGIAVMFLLFSATASCGSLLDEKDNSTLDRLLCSQLSMDQLLMGKWVFLTAIGCLQLFLMFLWGSVVFRIEVLRNWEGAVAMSLVTAGAASSFALLLATLCSSRNQLSWISTIVILSMSALGGSMIPRYLMSETIQNIGLITFNAWALDGFNKVFWRELPLDQIGLELGVLASCAGIFIVLARLFAVRWERT